MINEAEINNPFSRYVDLAQPRLGSTVVYATDDFFAEKARLIHPAAPIFVAGKYDDNGKWMDGWESRRKRTPGHDYCIVKLGVPGLIKGIDIDTSHFTGNYPPAAAIDGCVSAAQVPGENTAWTEVLARVDLAGDAHHYHHVSDTTHFTHLRLNIYPDGGIARLRVYGLIKPDWNRFEPGAVVDLVALQNGGQALACSNEHFGSMHNLNAPGRGIDMGDGWETARRRGPGHDWVIMRLGHAGVIRKIEIDTAHYKGNYPDRASLYAVRLAARASENLVEQSVSWPVLLPEVKLEMDRQQVFSGEVRSVGAVSHVRLNIFPDGGVSRIRLFGSVSA